MKPQTAFRGLTSNRQQAKRDAKRFAAVAVNKNGSLSKARVSDFALADTFCGALKKCSQFEKLNPGKRWTVVAR